jgi:hypothetical protein
MCLAERCDILKPRLTLRLWGKARQDRLTVGGREFDNLTVPLRKIGCVCLKPLPHLSFIGAGEADILTGEDHASRCDEASS